MQEPPKTVKNQNKVTRATAGSYKILRILLLLLLVSGIAFILAKTLKPRSTPLSQAEVLIRAGKAAAALPILEQLSFKHPDNPAVFPLLAQGYLSCDRVAEGRIALDTAIKLGLPEKDLLPAVLSYATYYSRKGDFTEAEKLLQSASTECPAEALNESKARLYFDWAEVEMKENHLEQAVTRYEQANKLISFSSGPLRALIPHRLSEGLRQLAALAETDENDDAKAISLLEKSLDVSDDPAARMTLAGIYTRCDRLDKAIENYQRVAQEDKNNLEARHHLIDLLIESADYEQAQNALVDLTGQEKSLENYQQLVAVDLKLQNYAGAVHALEDACDLSHKSELLKQLLSVLKDWSAVLTKEKKMQEAASVEGHAERVAELLANMENSERDTEADKNQASLGIGDKAPGVALVYSRTWLAQGSVTPEGEIKLKNISGRILTDLTLSVVFYDHTARRTAGSVILPVVTPRSPPFAPDECRTLYFSCPNIVKADHQLAVLLSWKGRFLREFPIIKYYGR